MTTLATLAQAREAFRQSPNQSTALAYLDAAITFFEHMPPVGMTQPNAELKFLAALTEIRDWLAIPQGL